MSRVQINSMAIKQIEKYYQQGILNKREVIAILMKENGWNFPEAKQIADYYERVFIKNSKQIKSSKYTPDELFNLCSWDMLENTVFLDRDQCKESKLGMSDLIDLLNEVAPSWAGVDTLDKLKDVCRKAKNPSAKARLEMLETAEDNARFTDKFYNSFKVHKQIKSTRTGENLEGYDSRYDGYTVDDNPYKFWIGMGDEKQYNDWNDGWESADYEINYLSKRR